MKTNQPTICFNCSKPLPSIGYFCGGCLTQFRCKSCGSTLEKDDAGCVNCGTPKEARTETKTASLQNLNTFRLHETATDRTIEATFSDDVAKDLAGTLRDAAAVGRMKAIASNSPSAKDFTTASEETIEFIDAEMANRNSSVSEIEPIHKTTTDTTKNVGPQVAYPHIDDLKVSLECSEVHWILIYAFYTSEYGKNNFNKELVLKKYKDSRDAGSRMANFSNKWKSLFPELIKTIKTDEFRITDKGRSLVQDLIAGKISSQPSTVHSGKKSKSKKIEGKGEKKQNSKKTSSGSSGSKRLTDIDFYADGKESLKDFYQKFEVKNDYENNLLFVYYFQEIRNIAPVTLNHLHTCYEELNLRIPENMHISVQNTKGRKGWIETIGKGNLAVTIKGRNKIKRWNEKD